MIGRYLDARGEGQPVGDEGVGESVGADVGATVGARVGASVGSAHAAANHPNGGFLMKQTHRRTHRLVAR